MIKFLKKKEKEYTINDLPKGYSLQINELGHIKLIDPSGCFHSIHDSIHEAVDDSILEVEGAELSRKRDSWKPLTKS